MKKIINAFSSFVKPAEILSELERDKELCASGLYGSSQSCALSLILEYCTRRGLNAIVITSSLDRAEDTEGDLSVFGTGGAEVFVPWDTDMDGAFIPDRSIISSKISQLMSLQDPQFDPLIFPAQALMQPLPPPDMLERHELVIRRGDTLSLSGLTEKLITCGCERVELVDNYGQFAVRGGIADIYPIGSESPFRIEFFGDTVESIRTFELNSQTSSAEIESCVISRISAEAVSRAIRGEEGCGPEKFLDRTDLCILINTPDILKTARETGAALSGEQIPFVSLPETLERISARMTLHLTQFPCAELPCMKFPSAADISDLFISRKNPVEKLAELSITNDLFICCQNSAEEHRISKLLGRAGRKKESSIHVFSGTVSAGFIIPSHNLALATTGEVFQRYRTRRPLRTKYDLSSFRPVTGFHSLEQGDYVVHLLNGIGRFRGLTVIKKDGISQEYITLEYAGEVVLHVPVTRINLLQKYIGGTREKPRLDRLGGKKWKKKREKAARAVENIAEDLLETQAERFRHSGIAYPPDSEWQHEFEASFMYEDTPDQAAAQEAIKTDMESPVPMDRLLCGDVGFGKTELAVRAAFKAALAGRQTAVLVPTTILAQQHYITFRERTADYPVTVDYLSRFKGAHEQKESVKRLKLGKTDIIIGTHRLLSDDIGFRDLGLLIIDEEQRFGVKHKERLKRFRKTVDLLTLTATPIPRTLHMSLLGIKDISSLRTPPEERKPILTKVTAFSDRVIRHAVRYELSRNGQVFFVHNRVYNIDYYVDYLQKLVPEANVGKVHGQMNENEIEFTMELFLNNDIDVLVCTTIIESGIDLPNVNTLIINSAHRFGLADLHQLRGRVGRFTRQAYAYLLIPPADPVSGEAAKRLKTIEQYSELGAGFRIALQDLEIRGAGNILGAEQSGHIAAIGYDLYCRILDTVIKRKQGRDTEDPFTMGPEIDLPVSAYIPSSYIRDFRLKIEIYRKIEETETPEETDRAADEIKDRFGPLPPEVSRLLVMQKIAIRAQNRNAERIYVKDKHLYSVYKNGSGREEEPISSDIRSQDDLCEWVLGKV